MREILFRGKRIDNNEWIEGNLALPNYELPNNAGLFLEGTAFICDSLYCIRVDDYDRKTLELGGFVQVSPSTIGQYTGLTDKNGKKIFEGDIVKVTDDDGEFSSCDCGCGKVIFLDGMWYVDEDVNNGLFNLNNAYYIEVIGNNHDNPELLGEG